MRKLMIAPSVGCCDLFHIEEQVKLINEKSDYLHMDIKDGVYVPSYGIGSDYLDYLNKHVDNLKPMDAHLMVKHPQQYLELFAKSGAEYITPHTDCIEGDAFVTINKIKELGEPDTSIIIKQYYYNMTVAEIGKAISMTAAAVQKRSVRARQKLKKMLCEVGINY